MHEKFTHGTVKGTGGLHENVSEIEFLVVNDKWDRYL